MGFPIKYLNGLTVSDTCVPDTCMLLNTHLRICHMHFFFLFPIFFLSLVKQLIRKIKSLENILDKDVSIDYALKDIGSASASTPHSAGCLYLPIDDLLHNYWNTEIVQAISLYFYLL